MNPYEMVGRIVAWLDQHILAKPEPKRLNCGCPDEGIYVGCLHCEHVTCERHRSDQHDCVAKEPVNA